MDRVTFSANEWFVLAMRQLPQVTVMGTPTGGGLGSRVARELPNGWSFGVVVQRTTSMDGELFEEVGIPPDLLVEMSAQDVGALRDPVLERAIAHLTPP